MTLPLEGIVVADFSWVVAGPYATQALALLGAEVIKFESAVHTDLLRRIPPFFKDVAGPERAGLWQALNLGKKSVTLDLRQPRAQELCLEIVRQSDVIVENFAYGQMEEFNLTFERFRSVKPDIIMVTSSGLGRTGPYRNYVCFGPPMTAYTGLAAVTGRDGGAPDRGLAGIWSDHLSGLTALYGVLAALEHRDRTGEGQLVEYSMAEAVAAQIPEAFIEYACTGVAPGPIGNRDGAMCPHGLYRAAGEDRWVAITVADDAAWKQLCSQMGAPAAFATLDTLEKRLARREEIDAHVAAWTRDQDPFVLAAALQAAGVAAANVSQTPDLIADPHLAARGFYLECDHPELGRLPYSGLPWQFDGGPAGDVPHSPLLGEHNWEIFVERLGLDPVEFAELVDAGVIV